MENQKGNAYSASNCSKIKSKRMNSKVKTCMALNTCNDNKMLTHG